MNRSQVTKAAHLSSQRESLSMDGGWRTYAEWQNSSEAILEEFSATWSVPPEPTKDDAQIVYLFSGLMDTDRNFIIQPVLQWGRTDAGSEKGWSVASWYAIGTVGGSCTEATPVKPGHKLVTKIYLTALRDNYAHYRVEISDIPQATLNVLGVAPCTWASVALEAYWPQGSKPQRADYPSVDSTSFEGLALICGTNDCAPSWKALADPSASLGEHSTVTPDGKTVTIVY